MTTDTKELEERLRTESSKSLHFGTDSMDGNAAQALMAQAADALASMRAENERLRNIPRDQPPEMGSPEDIEAMGWVSYKSHCEYIAAQEKEIGRLRYAIKRASASLDRGMSPYGISEQLRAALGKDA